MPTNKLLSYALFAILFALLALAGYKACQMQKEAKLQAQEEAELTQSLRDMGYPLEDTTGGTGYAGGDIDYSRPASPQSATSSAYDQPATSSPSTQPASTTAAEPAQPQTAARGQSNGGRIVDYSAESEPLDGRYRVVAGSFRIKDNARRQMEQLIRMGYRDSEVGLYNRGAYAVVIVKRTDNLGEANQIVDALEDKGIDAAVIDRVRK